MKRQADIDALRILDCYHDEGLSVSETGEALGISRNSVAGTIWRIRIAHEEAGPCHCRKPENQDGGMPRRWWA